MQWLQTLQENVKKKTVQFQTDMTLDETLHNAPAHVRYTENNTQNVYFPFNRLHLHGEFYQGKIKSMRHRSKQATLLFGYVPSDLSDWPLCKD